MMKLNAKRFLGSILNSKNSEKSTMFRRCFTSLSSQKKGEVETRMYKNNTEIFRILQNKTMGSLLKSKLIFL